MNEVEAWKYFAGQALAGLLAGRASWIAENYAAEKAGVYADEMTKLFKQKYSASLPEK